MKNRSFAPIPVEQCNFTSYEILSSQSAANVCNGMQKRRPNLEYTDQRRKKCKTCMKENAWRQCESHIGTRCVYTDPHIHTMQAKTTSNTIYTSHGRSCVMNNIKTKTKGKSENSNNSGNNNSNHQQQQQYQSRKINVKRSL